jgi:phage baseplate assembly protein W
MPQFVYQDLNVRDEFVTNSTDFLIYDEKVIVQSIWRLLTTQEGEIPNFRIYGLNVKRFSQYPLTKETINTIYNYVKNRIAAFEERATVVRADVDASFERQVISMSFYIQMNTTGSIVKLPVWNIKVGSA